MNDDPADAFVSTTPVTLLGAAPLAPRLLALALAHAPRLVAADGGADAALAAGQMPERVIGDLDSISVSARARLAERLIHVPAQDDTDLDKALDRIDAPLILGAGFAGGRLDHTLAAMSALMRRPGRRVVLLAEGQLCFLTPPALTLDLAPGTLISLYPMAPVSCRSAGLHWPTDGLELAPGGMIGTSNRVAEPAPSGGVWLAPYAPALMCLLPLSGLEAALTGLRAAPAWPAAARAR